MSAGPRPFDLSNLELAREFRRQPYGRHSDALQRLLTVMRSEPVAGHHVLVQESRHGPFRLARLGAKRGDAITILDESCPDRAAGEWALFLRRWRQMGGVEID